LSYLNNTSVSPGASYPIQVGAGGTSGSAGAGGGGAVRVVWPGASRSFPSTNVGSPW
jgi:hypothetical protein